MIPTEIVASHSVVVNVTMIKCKVLLCMIINCIVIYDEEVTSLKLLETKKYAPSWSRRKMLEKSVGWFVFCGYTVTSTTAVANAIAPITQRETDTGMAKAMRLFRRDPPKILRQKLSQDFAVLLMRTSYSIVDLLDIVPMNQFQRDFFLIRSAEYEPYVQSLGPGYITQQGDLTDPSYFDFISFAQFATINRVLSDPATVFEELQPVPTTASSTTTVVDMGDDGGSVSQRFEPKVVRRTISNDQLIPMYNKQFGAAILQYLDDTYGSTPIALTIKGSSGGSNNRRPSVDSLQASLTQLVKLFLINGFAWDGRVDVIRPPKQQQQRDTTSDTKNDDAADDDAAQTGVSFCIVLDSPASLWGNESLHRQRAKLTNDYILIVATEFIQQRTGYRVVSSSVKFQNNSELSYIKLK